ncbi:hypothetical protein N410_03415 [Helicobacter pylori GC26]|nr:hypothetical protein N410_03415 [Helicobacter pylori GC26]
MQTSFSLTLISFKNFNRVLKRYFIVLDSIL